MNDHEGGSSSAGRGAERAGARGPLGIDPAGPGPAKAGDPLPGELCDPTEPSGPTGTAVARQRPPVIPEQRSGPGPDR